MALVYDGTVNGLRDRVADLEGEVFGPDGSAYQIGNRLNGVAGTTVGEALVTATGRSTARSLAARAADVVNVLDFIPANLHAGIRARTDTTNLRDYIVDATEEAGATGRVWFPRGRYYSSPLAFTTPVHLIGETGVRLVAAGAGTALVHFDFDGAGSSWGYGGSLDTLILDGAGLVADGLLLSAVVSAKFNDIRVTNVTAAGFHLAWAQLCEFTNPTVSHNVEAFTTTPVNGILMDGASSSAGTFTNATIEHVSGTGIRMISGVNSLFLNGTSEGNGGAGIELGETVVGSQTAIGNTFIGMDLEVNVAGDIILRTTAYANDFIGLKSGYNSPPVQVLGSGRNTFVGGVTSGFEFDSLATANRVYGVSLLGATATIVDEGTNNTILDVSNISTAEALPSTMNGGAISVAKARNYVATGEGEVAVDSRLGDHAVVTAPNGVSSFYMIAPVNGMAGDRIEVTIRNASGGALTVTWAAAAFRLQTWTSPADGNNRSIAFRFDGNVWNQVSALTADVPN